MALSEDEITDWLVEYLSADSELTSMLNGYVAADVRGSQNPSPLVLVQRLDGSDVRVVGLHKIWTECVYHVRGAFHWQGSGPPDRAEINAIGARIQELLGDEEGFEVLTGTIHVHGWREEPEPLPSFNDTTGDLWLQSGGIYRIRASAV